MSASLVNPINELWDDFLDMGLTARDHLEKVKNGTDSEEETQRFLTKANHLKTRAQALLFERFDEEERRKLYVIIEAADAASGMKH
jgi:hypothetical protein